MPSSESYLVVGGCGFLGRHIVEQLLARGETQVSVFDIVQRHFDSNVNFYIGDISKPEDVENALTKSGATAVIHTASPAHNLGRQLYELVNVTGTRTLLDACLPSPTVKKFVYTSSGGVIFNGDQDVVCADERLRYPERALDAYNETKVAAEKMVIAANGEQLLTCAIRPAGIFGEGDRQMINAFYEVVKNNQTKFQIGYNDNLADFTYVGNVAHAHLLAVDKLGTTYPYSSFRDPLDSIELSTGALRVPTSDAHPLGPNTSPSEASLFAARRYESGQHDPADLRPVLRNRMDQFNNEASLEDESSDAGYPIAGQVFFITNGEPIYFWDFTRSVWKGLGHIPPYRIILPAFLGLILATLAEAFSKFRGKEPGFTRFRVSQAINNRYYDIERARRLLGYEPIVGLVEGMERWTSWYRGELAKQSQTVESDKTK
ncbi:putative C-3 sterol dehydrogenase [Naematelia encephala]|uniref:Putative C-3 sterol dehydrogenase n=1 Tax=Naematelia encephala TaxID=71784 RepID=A0A1Y2B941_9TREE|nr:putative C-3 sterol dehydrogenase [Naematelia encephala]